MSPLTTGVFVSYAAENRDAVLRIVERLEHQGIRLWLDRYRISGGMPWAREIVRAIRQSSVLLLMCSDAALRSRAVAQEVQLAWKYQLAYVPVLLHPTTYTEQLEFFLEGVEWIDADSLDDTVWMSKIVESLGRLGIPVDGGRLGRTLGDGDRSLAGLRRLAAFTNRIWPLVVDSVDRSSHRTTYVVRDLGPAAEGARHEIRLGSRVFWAIDWDQPAHLLLLNEGAEGKTYCLCPSWFCPNDVIEPGITLLPPKRAHCEPFVITGQPGREHILAILSTQPLASGWMPPDPTTPARELSAFDISDLAHRLQHMEVGTWTAMATYCDVTISY